MPPILRQKRPAVNPYVRAKNSDNQGDAGLQLNRGEHRQSLAKWLFFANQGEFRGGRL
jgi:hypothetical protein